MTRMETVVYQCDLCEREAPGEGGQQDDLPNAWRELRGDLQPFHGDLCPDCQLQLRLAVVKLKVELSESRRTRKMLGSPCCPRGKRYEDETGNSAINHPGPCSQENET